MASLPRVLAAADLMTIDPIVVRDDTSIEDAQDLIRRYRVSGLPVVDDRGGLVGVVSQTDFVNLSGPLVTNMVRRRPSGIRVGEVMSSPPVTVRLTTSVAEAARVMNSERVHRLVVVDDAGHPIGVLSAMDYVALAAEG